MDLLCRRPRHPALDSAAAGGADGGVYRPRIAAVCTTVRSNILEFRFLGLWPALLVLSYDEGRIDFQMWVTRVESQWWPQSHADVIVWKLLKGTTTDEVSLPHSL